MLFIDSFFLFLLLPLALVCFYAVGRTGSRTACLAVIVLVSAIFYAPYGPVPSLLLLGSLTMNLCVGVTMTRLSDRFRHARGALLTAGLVTNFALLGLFKYTNDLAVLAGAHEPIWRYAIPAGISFYTFHQAVFLVDAHARKPEVTAFLGKTDTPAAAGATAVRYAAFVAFFPQLVIGPIVYLSEFAPQVLRRSFGRLSTVNLYAGITLMIFGLFKKVCIADPIGLIISPTYDLAGKGDLISTSQALFAIPGFFIQLYFDFSGYSDIALGIARLFGVVLPVNFDSPLRATGIIDFYRRWHITLTRVIARFLFTPLAVAGTRFAMGTGLKGWARRAASAWLPMIANFLVIALWHGAKETFLAFGLIHGVWYILETEWRRTPAFKAIEANLGERWRAMIGQAICVVPLMLTFSLFRSDNLAGFGRLLWRLTHWSSEIKYFTIPNWPLLLFAALVAYLAPNAQEMMRRYRPGIRTFDNRSLTPQWLRLRWRPNLLWGAFLAALLAITLRKLSQPAPFLYGGF